MSLVKELCKVRDWLSENKLMLHLGNNYEIRSFLSKLSV